MVKVLEVNNLNYQDYHHINLAFDEKKIYSIIGSNNSGKSTLLRIISGIIPTNSCIICDNIALNRKNKIDFIKKIGVVKSFDNQKFLYSNVYDEMAYPLYNLGYCKKSIQKRISDILDCFKLGYIQDKKIVDLTIYEKQKLLLCIALLHKPQVLLIDSALDLFSYSEQKEIIDILKEENLTVINFTSCLNEAYLSDRIILINNFKVIKELSVKEMFQDDKVFYDNDLEVPLICNLNIKLRMYNLINKDYMTPEEMVDDIWH